MGANAVTDNILVDVMKACSLVQRSAQMWRSATSLLLGLCLQLLVTETVQFVHTPNLDKQCGKVAKCRALTNKFKDAARNSHKR